MMMSVLEGYKFYTPDVVDARYEVLYRQFKGLDVGPVDYRDFDAWFCKRRFDRVPYCFNVDEPLLDLKVKPLTSAERMRRLRARSKVVNEVVDVYVPKPLRALVSDLVRVYNDTGVVPVVTCDDDKLDKIRAVLDTFPLHPTSPRCEQARRLVALLREIL